MTKVKFNPIIPVKNDDLFVEQVGEWAKEKYSLVGVYCDIFTKSMKSRWGNLVYIDLFAGCGYSRIKDTKTYIKSSPLIALSVPNKFTKYIFCEENNEKCKSLERRIKGEYNDLNYIIIKGDCNKRVESIKNALPKYSKNNTVLSFCFADPYAMSNLNFITIERLSQFMIDFLILIPTGMDARRNLKYYLDGNNETVDYFIDNRDWREKFRKTYKENNQSFVSFLKEIYSNKMVSLGYKEPGSFHLIKSINKNLPLYHLAFFSKHALGNKFWDAVNEYSSQQVELFS
ncbi:MAG: three-Cys-motif partner protein TcmP [Ignavibacteria bacterium]|jgi:three-Cys-motif partner protein